MRNGQAFESAKQKTRQKKQDIPNKLAPSFSLTFQTIYVLICKLQNTPIKIMRSMAIESNFNYTI